MMVPEEVSFVRRLDIPYSSVVARIGTAIHLELRVRRFGFRVPMWLLVSPLSSVRSMTMVELIPCRNVRATRRYFAVGHHFLDELVSELGADRPEPEEAI